ncbi:Lrp/AsnC family transcriptional regulator [Candidatus Woesearchaeota archaeon]|nr:Lrp/AsnC family transcriptional regulator [Candidatus Woesearchaeota archaeon]
MILKEKEVLLLKQFRVNARMKLTSMSRKTGIPVTSIFDKITNLDKIGIIKKYTILLDYELIGFEIKAILIIKINKKQKTDLKEFLSHHHSVNSLYRINNGFDFILEVIFKNMKIMDDFLEKIEKNFDILKLEIHYILEELKREDFNCIDI